jgi:hypothetical protein
MKKNIIYGVLLIVIGALLLAASITVFVSFKATTLINTFVLVSTVIVIIFVVTYLIVMIWTVLLLIVEFMEKINKG